MFIFIVIEKVINLKKKLMDYFDGQSTKFKLMIKFFQASYDCLLFLIVVQRDVVAVAFAVVLGVVCLLLILCVAALIHLYKITPGGIKIR